MTDALADELERLAEEATPGEWAVGFDDLDCIWSRQPTNDGNVICLPPEACMELSLERWTANAALIVALRNNLPTILSALREREEPCAECAAVSAAIGGPDFMDPPDGGDVPLSEQVRRMRAALREREPTDSEFFDAVVGWLSARDMIDRQDALDGLTVADVIAALDEHENGMATALREREPVAWRPIETAPKDGRTILLWDSRRGVAVSGRWHVEPTIDNPTAYEPGWSDWTADDDLMIWDDGSSPSHWMPLPAAPAPTLEHQEEQS